MDVRYDLETLRNAFIMGPTEKRLFSQEQSKENLRWSNENATDEEAPSRLRARVCG